MNRSLLKNILILLALFLSSLLLMQFVWRVSTHETQGDSFSAEKVNLALRRTAHYLLKESGDSTSLIPPVAQTGKNVWLVKLERSFDYDRLPFLLQESFDQHDIRRNYDVTVLHCGNGELLLGYNFLDFKQNESAPCGGRTVEADCYNLQVTFPEAVAAAPKFPREAWFFSGFIALILFGIRLKWRPAFPPQQAAQSLEGTTEWLHFGQSKLDVSNQVLISNNVRHVLTYREAKLLHLFASRTNQLLERNFILENVWADEGILVGRSVDMFVSRLRKMLREDSSLRLVAVHGVGYRLEVG